MLDLRGSAYIVLASAEGDDGGRTPPVLALPRLVRNLADLHRNGRLVGALERPPQPHDRRKMLAEILASFLRGQLSPRDAETEIAVTDLLEETGRVAGDARRMFYALAGRPTGVPNYDRGRADSPRGGDASRR